VIFTHIPIDGAYLVELEPRIDQRGSFARAFCKREFSAAGIEFDIAQCNLARTERAGIVRGLHFQPKPVEDAKLVRCLSGAVFDAMVDMRPSSPTYRRTFWMRLDAVARHALFIPGGVAHGYQALCANTEFLYMTDRYYEPGIERGVRFDDPSAGIPWPMPALDVADRDTKWPLLDGHQ
jgi:dTDP-4-dehydrorhamnose 3,5-epimerase